MIVDVPLCTAEGWMPPLSNVPLEHEAVRADVYRHLGAVHRSVRLLPKETK